MAAVEVIRSCVQSVLQEYARQSAASDDVDVQTIFDIRHDHYQVVNVGWREERRIYGTVLHIDIKDEKAWVQYNGTEVDVAAELLQCGLSKEDIVIGFHAPYKRRATGFAMG